jgi:putative ABC transport system substrate-binding protein
MVSLGAMLTVILSLSLLAAPLAAEAQVSGRVPRVGVVVNVRSPVTDAFERGLKDLGYEDGKNIASEWRFQQGDPTRLRELVADLVRLQVDVIWAPDEVRVNAVRKATNTIPIVFTAVSSASCLRPPRRGTSSMPGPWR